MSQAASRFEINPLCVKGLRSRCRLKFLISWGAIWLTISTFVFLSTYLTLVEQELSSKADAAKAALPGILVIQSIILMLFGTSTVASGVAQERDEGLLDYIRMTPMSPTAKVLGYLFGLPIREYILFAFTLPLVAIIVIISGFSLLTLAHFYLVFFTSVLVYHMTALVVGTVSPKPRLASMMSMGLVVILYFALPNLSRVGITFFEFLTIRPTFLGLLQQELPDGLRARAELNGIDTFRPVPFFNGTVRPTLYTIMVQGFLIAVMFSIVYRKWRDQANHLFSKTGALVVFGGVATFTLASIWSVVAQDEAYHQLFNPFGSMDSSSRIPQTLYALMMIGLMILGGTYLFLICATTPSRNRTLVGFRQMRRLGRSNIPLAADAASSFPLAMIMLTITALAGAAILMLAHSKGDYIASSPSAQSILTVLVLLFAIGLSIQALAERIALRAFGVAAFLLWMIPFFTMVIFMAAFEAYEVGFYVGQPFPPVSMGLALGWLLESTTPVSGGDVSSQRFLPTDDNLTFHPQTVVTAGTIGYAAAALVLQRMRLRHRRHLKGMQ